MSSPARAAANLAWHVGKEAGIEVASSGDKRPGAWLAPLLPHRQYGGPAGRQAAHRARPDVTKPGHETGGAP